jgi:hypothetical protein
MLFKIFSAILDKPTEPKVGFSTFPAGPSLTAPPSAPDRAQVRKIRRKNEKFQRSSPLAAPRASRRQSLLHRSLHPGMSDAVAGRSALGKGEGRDARRTLAAAYPDRLGWECTACHGAGHH